jgi:CHAD domain-containing protein
MDYQHSFESRGAMSEPPVLRPGQPVGESLRAIAGHLLTEAHDILEDESREPAVAVHDIRKELKRWRAMLRLLAPFLNDDSESLRVDARALARKLTSARDAQSAIDAFHDAIDGTLHLPPTLAPGSLVTIHARLEDRKKANQNEIWDDETRQALSDYITAASYQVSHWPLQISFADLADRLATTYRRARKALPEEWKGAVPDDLHELRRRVIEHRYQMELVEPAWPRLGRIWVDEAQRLRNRLGAFQNLAVLMHLTEPHQPLAAWRSRLVPLISYRQAEHAKSASRVAARLFAEPPKAFRRRLEALWEAQGT